MQTNRHLPILLIFFLGLMTSFAHGATAGDRPSRNILQNDRLKITFNRQGIHEIYDKELQKSYEFLGDQFSFTIDGKTVGRSHLNLQDIKQKTDTLSYFYTSKNFRIKAVYILKAQWHFVGKQLFITPIDDNSFHVDNVKVIMEKLSHTLSDKYIPKTRYKHSGAKDYGAFLRFPDRTGMFVTVQNPFLNYRQHGNAFSLDYSPDMQWESSYGTFASDMACIGIYAISGKKIPVHMIPEWKWTGAENNQTEAFEYQSEVDAFKNCVRQFVLDQQKRPLNVQVAWSENDYQIDVATASGRDVYRRIINRTSQIGAEYLLYQPTNSNLGNFTQASDNWHVEDRLWLGMGIQIRKNEWNPRSDSLPSSVQTLLDYADRKGVKLVAYVYPILPFQQNKDWLVTQHHPNGHTNVYANLGNHAFQDWLIDEMSAFKRSTGIGGYSFDYTFLKLPGKSTYAQWWGWRRVMETMRKRFPDILMDGRQLYQNYGPWIWLAGSYPHPTSTDEQPQSFNPFPDLHFDRVSANRERYTAYRYRIRDYCPQVLMPGFIGHQTDKHNFKGEREREPFHRRDWDYLGWKYSLISSIAYGGLNNVINMIPARDPEEYKLFPKEDIAFFKRWLDWTGTNRKYLKHTQPILGQPAIGKVDGTSAILNDKGYIFLINPNGRAMDAHFNLDRSIGLKGRGKYVIREQYPEKGKAIGKPDDGVWKYGDEVSVHMNGSRARVLKLEPLSGTKEGPLLFNVAGDVGLRGGELQLIDVKGETGTRPNAMVYLPDPRKIHKVLVNGKPHPFEQQGQLVKLDIPFSGQQFHHMQQAGSYDSTFSGGHYEASFTIPQRVFSQLKARAKRYPIPWTQVDRDTPWLVPQRLPLFVQIAQPSDTMDVTMKLNGKPIKLTKAYTTVQPRSRDFVGFYFDCSSLEPGKTYHVDLQLPHMKPGQFQGLFFDNIVTDYTKKIEE